MTSVIDQCAISLQPKYRLASFLGAVLGGFIPIASFVVAHLETTEHPERWIFVAGGMTYSAMTVYSWASIAFSNRIKAVGFILLVEGVAIFASTFALNVAALTILVAINALATAYNLIAQQRDIHAQTRPEKIKAGVTQKRRAAKPNGSTAIARKELTATKRPTLARATTIA